MLFISLQHMHSAHADEIIRSFHDWITSQSYPCVAARAAMQRGHIACLIAAHMACPADDDRILSRTYSFIEQFRMATTSLHSLAIIFQGPENTTEESFDTALWQRLQALNTLDARKFPYDKRVNSDPSAADFSYSLGEEAFFIIGLHPGATRRSRQFKYPTIVLNPHIQFQTLRTSDSYQKMKAIVRQRDMLYSGSVNPMLSDFGEVSETFQYSGRQYESDWRCPLKVAHEKSTNNSPAQ